MSVLKEVCVESLSEALNAVHAGATRIELCENLAVGGTTPSYGTIKKSKETLPVPFMVMIRPRGGDFVYTGKVTNENFEQVKSMVPSDEFHGRELVGNIAL